MELKVYSSGPALVNVPCVGINPYKQVELHIKYRKHVPIHFQDDVLYARPVDQVMMLVKVERSERSIFRKKLKETKSAGMKARIERIAYLDDDGNEHDTTAAAFDGDEDEERDD